MSHFNPIAYSFDHSREELVERFRLRIQQGDRTRLRKAERAELALHFVDRLQRCQSEEEASALCQEEIALLEEGYPVVSVANQYLPEWRKVIERAVEEGRLPQQNLEPNEFGKQYSHWGLKYLLYPNTVQRALKEKTTIANNQKQDDLKPIRADRFIQTARGLLAGRSPQEWEAGLLALTGRRFSEIAARGTFEEVEHPYAIAFRGQLKKGIQNPEEAQTFIIASLIDAKEILEALERFRAHPRVQELAELDPIQINSRFNGSVRYHIRQAFEHSQLIPVLASEKSVSAHNLRGVYATIATHFFCPPQQATHRFVQAHLGHVIGAEELARRRNAGATEHYFHYFLVGAQGQQLSEKGILLDRFPPLPTSIEPLEKPSDRPSEPIKDELQEQQSLLELTYPEIEEKTMATRKQKQSSHRSSRASVPSELMQELKTIASRKFNLQKSASYTEVLEAVIGFLENGATSTLTASVESFGATFQWFTQEVEQLRQQIAVAQQERERAVEQVESVQAEKEKAIAQLRSLQEQDSGEVDALKAENEALKAELMQFYQLRQMLLGEKGTVDVRKVEEQKAIAPAQTSPHPSQSEASTASNLTNQRTGSDSKTETNGKAEANGAGQHTGKKNSSKDDEPSKRIMDDDIALDYMNEAIDLIFAWNDQPGREFNHKWYISVPVLQQLLRGSGYTASQPRVRTALEQRRKEIDEHHLRHGMSQRHNARHNSPITEDLVM